MQSLKAFFQQTDMGAEASLPSSKVHPSIDLEASFSYGSDEEEDGRTSSLKQNQQHSSFRLNIRKGIKSNNSVDGTASRDDEMNGASIRDQPSPLSRREKLKRSTKVISNNKEAQLQLQLLNSASHESSNGKDYYSSSWRSKNVNFKNVDFVDEDGMTSSQRSDGSNTASTEESSDPDKAAEYQELKTISSSMKETLDDDRYFVRASTGLSVKNSTSTNEKKKISEKTIQKQFSGCVDIINTGEWHLLLRNIQVMPVLLSFQSPKHGKKTLFHIVASKKENIPAKVLQSLIAGSIEGLQKPDSQGNLPLHYAASVSRSEVRVNAFLRAWKGAASARNIDGDLPLHVSVWTGSSNVNIVSTLLKCLPSALITPNDVGATPLHLACCGTSSSHHVVRHLLEVHEEMEFPVNTNDISGNSPLHVAIKTCAPIKVLEAFKEISGDESFHLRSSEGMNAFQVALSAKRPDPSIVYYLSEISVGFIKSAMPDGKMPALVAAQKKMPSPLVKKLILADLPVHLGTQNMRELTNVGLRTHGYTWWHMATKHGEYATVFDEILAHLANIQEICALAQESDPDGYSCLFQKCESSIRNVFKKHLKLGDRYEVIATFRCLIEDGLLKVCALDWGDRIGWEEMAGTNKDPHMVQNGYIEVAPDTNDSTEVVFYSHPQREVVLHCCVKDSDQYDKLEQEMDARRRFNFSHLDTQRIYNVHTFEARKIGCVGEMLCVSFERPLLTLADVFDTSRFRKRKNDAWTRKTINLLKRLAQVINYFHSVGYIHGHINPKTLAKFVGSNNWKLMDLRHAVPIGSSMRDAELHLGCPPETVSSSSLGNASRDMMPSVSFDDNFTKTKTINYSVSMDELRSPCPSFSPEQCVADPSWDIFSFGLIMGQLILGQSMVCLPNFEHSRDAHLKKLHQFDDEALKKIGDGARRVSNWKAADLLISCLQVLPEDRPKDMEEVLAHAYFRP
jgi:hypothetical protein